MSIKSLLTGTGMRLAVATAVISGATLGSQTFNNDSPSFDPSASVLVPAFTPTSFTGQGGSSSPAATSTSTGAMPVVAHSTLGSVSGAGSSAASSSSLGHSFSGGSSAAGIHVSTPSSAGGGGGSAASGSGGGSSAGGSMGTASLAMAASTFAASSAPAMGAGPSRTPALAEAPASTLELYKGDEPGIILADDFAESPIVTSYGQPIGSAVLPLLILALLFAYYKHRQLSHHTKTIIKIRIL